MSQHLLHDLGVDVLREQERSAGLPERWCMHPDVPQVRREVETRRTRCCTVAAQWPRGVLDPIPCSPSFTCKSIEKESGPDETRTRDLRHARAERRFRRRSLSFEKPLKQAESANRLTTDVRHCSRRLSSNCRQLHKQILGTRGKLIHRSASLFDTRTCCAGGLRARGSGKGIGQATDWFYAGSCKRTSENSPSTHSGE
jgi:hypothetical protein